MDPISIVHDLVSIVNYIRDAVQQVKQNQKQCENLATQVGRVVELMEGEVKNGVSADVVDRLLALQKALTDLRMILDELANQKLIKKCFWRQDVSRQIEQANKDLTNAVQIFDLGTKFDLRRFQEQNEVARRADNDQFIDIIQKVQDNDHQILEFLDVQKVQMQEVMMALQKRFLSLENSFERQFLEKGMHAMQRSSGHSVSPPDTSLITSLEVIIYHHKKLGAGGYGQVYEGNWNGNVVAIKVMDVGVDPRVFQAEVDVWKNLHHPNILQFFGACAVAEAPFIVCSLKAGGDAIHYLRQDPSADRCKIIYEASRGLEWLHNRAVIHGDLKASNILIDDLGVACLSDFGLSKIKLSTTMASQSISLGGTPFWMSPEQMTLGVSNKMTDVYSFGMTIYEIFTGSPPFSNIAESLLSVTVVDRRLHPPRPTEEFIIQRGLGNALWTILEECWSYEPKQRPTAAIVASRLSAVHPTHSNANLTTPELSQARAHSEQNVVAQPRPITSFDQTPTPPDHSSRPKSSVSSSLVGASSPRAPSMPTALLSESRSLNEIPKSLNKSNLNFTLSRPSSWISSKWLSRRIQASQYAPNVYARNLLLKGRGYPLWLPETSNLDRERTRVSVGDVGTITADGAFDTLFNVFFNVYDGPRLVGSRPEQLFNNTNPHMAGTILMSEGLTSSPELDMHAGLPAKKFHINSSEGAVLVLPDGTCSENARNLDTLRRFAIENGPIWYDYAIKAHGRAIPEEGPLCLITGCDYTKSWALAAFSRKDQAVSFGDQSFALRAGQWDTGGVAEGRVGHGEVDQTVFVRGFTIYPGNWFKGLTFKAKVVLKRIGEGDYW